MDELENAENRSSVHELLLHSDLLHYYDDFRFKLKVTSISHLKYVSECDLEEIGMTKPEQRRLNDVKQNIFPDSIFGKFKKVVKESISLHTKDDKHEKLHNAHSSEITPFHNQQHIIPSSKIVLCRQLGCGEFGEVWQGVWKVGTLQKIQVAIKRISSEKLSASMLNFVQEAAIMHKIHDEHIVKFFGVVLEPKNIMLVTELAPLRSLLECLKQQKSKLNFDVLCLCDFAQQICSGMAYLENNRLIHRDLAARNILTYTLDRVKISDFGLSRALGVGEDYYRGDAGTSVKLPIAWCAPECIKFMKFTSLSDVWSFGVTLWEMFSYGLQPWLGLTGRQILDAIDTTNGQRLEIPDDCPWDYYNLMLQMWQHDPENRPKFSQLCSMLTESAPEILSAVSSCLDGQPDHLQYECGDLVVILSKKPREYPDGYYWKGLVVKKKFSNVSAARTGLFLPSNFVAYLCISISPGSISNVSEFCSMPSSVPCTPVSGRKFQNKLEDMASTQSLARNYKNCDKQKRLNNGHTFKNFANDVKKGVFGKSHAKSGGRLSCKEISLPGNDFRHTGHLGLDGSKFGDVVVLENETQHHVSSSFSNSIIDDVSNSLSDLDISCIGSNSGLPRFPVSMAKARIVNNVVPPRPAKRTTKCFNKITLDSSPTSLASTNSTTFPTSRSKENFTRSPNDSGGSLFDEVFDELQTLDIFTAKLVNVKDANEAKSSKSGFLSSAKNDDGCASYTGNINVTKSSDSNYINGIKPLSVADEKMLQDLAKIADKISDKALDAERKRLERLLKPLDEEKEVASSVEPRTFCDILPPELATNDVLSLTNCKVEDAGARAYKMLVERGEDVNPLRLIRNNGTSVALSFHPKKMTAKLPPPPVPPKPFLNHVQNDVHLPAKAHNIDYNFDS